MRCSLVLASFIVLSAALPGAAQSSDSAAAPVAPQDPAAVQTPSQTPSPDAAASADAKKQKKIWTNDNVSDANGGISVVGNSRNASKYKATTERPADPQLVARLCKDLEKLQTQMDDTDKKLALYKNFQEGEAVSTNVRQLDKGVSRVPIDQQISALQEKKKQIQIRIDALLDEARQKGMLPGQLR